MHIHPMRGQVVIRELSETANTLTLVNGVWRVPGRERDVKTHRGTVLAIGAPALEHGHPVPHGFKVGDEVIFHFIHNKAGHTLEWSDGKLATWVPQSCVDAVLE